MAAEGAVHSVGAALRFEVREPTRLALQLAPATTTGSMLAERLDLSVGSAPVDAPVVEILTAHGGRVHLIDVGVGTLDVLYEASVRTGAATAGPPSPIGDPEPPDTVAPDLGSFSDAELVALRQSRYCPSDELAGFAAREFAPGTAPETVASWVFERLRYTPGVSTSLHTAVDTLLAAEGVCRDFAHLTIALCRALGIPARLVSVYAPGLSPMDFHAVVEVHGAGGWRVLDPTRLAPRPTLLRIGTGRDAADTAFASTVSGDVELLTAEVWATTDGDLPLDDHVLPVQLP